jgi:hypothetical protein
MSTIEYGAPSTKIAACKVELSATCRFCQSGMDRFYVRKLLDPRVTLEHFATDTGKWFECQDQTPPTTVL